jgi:hypothetical protein
MLINDVCVTVLAVLHCLYVLMYLHCEYLTVSVFSIAMHPFYAEECRHGLLMSHHFLSRCRYLTKLHCCNALGRRDTFAVCGDA